MRREGAMSLFRVTPARRYHDRSLRSRLRGAATAGVQHILVVFSKTFSQNRLHYGD